MRSFIRILAFIASIAGTTEGVAAAKDMQVELNGPTTITSGTLHSVQLIYHDKHFEGELRIFYAACNSETLELHSHEIGTTIVKKSAQPQRLIWAVPDHLYSGGCLHAYSNSTFIGRSEPVVVSRKQRKRQSIADIADTTGPWFEGIAYLQSKNISSMFVGDAKAKKIAIVGGGMAGLMTALLLDSVGLTNWHITESSQRVGGRIRTRYLNNTRPDQYQYQEMGPMRFPVSAKYADTNETLDIQDHKMVFQLADVVNSMNGNNSELMVNFIPWIQSSPNVPTNSRGYRLPNGRIPSAAQLKADPSLQSPPSPASDPQLATYAAEQLQSFEGINPDLFRSLARNVYKAHKQAIAKGIFHFSEAAYLRYQLGLNDNITDYVAGSTIVPMWSNLYENGYFSATTWRTIDKGLESLPKAFGPLIKNRITFGRKIEGLTYDANTSQITINWRNDPLSMTPESEKYDYAVVAVPFTKVRLWRTPQYSSLLSRAINTMNYEQSCKVALHYKTRFWEHLSPPIIGGCGSVDIPGIANICYPSYQINSTGPGVILASYASGAPCRSVGALSVADHVGLVQRAMVEAHGPIAAEQYTGIFERQIWHADENIGAAWADPTVGQQDLYLPAYFQTEFKTIFIGEHTSYTHAWIFSALDSAVRGTCQLLLDLGLVDEAKQIVNTWMARWIDI